MANVTPYARQEWRFVLCSPLQAQVASANSLPDIGYEFPY